MGCSALGVLKETFASWQSTPKPVGQQFLGADSRRDAFVNSLCFQFVTPDLFGLFNTLINLGLTCSHNFRFMFRKRHTQDVFWGCLELLELDRTTTVFVALPTGCQQDFQNDCY